MKESVSCITNNFMQISAIPPLQIGSSRKHSTHVFPPFLPNQLLLLNSRCTNRDLGVYYIWFSPDPTRNSRRKWRFSLSSKAPKRPPLIQWFIFTRRLGPFWPASAPCGTPLTWSRLASCYMKCLVTGRNNSKISATSIISEWLLLLLKWLGQIIPWHPFNKQFPTSWCNSFYRFKGCSSNSLLFWQKCLLDRKQQGKAVSEIERNYEREHIR